MNTVKGSVVKARKDNKLVRTNVVFCEAWYDPEKDSVMFYFHEDHEGIDVSEEIAGATAFMQGKKPADCPHPRSDERIAWVHGWYEANRVARHVRKLARKEGHTV